MRGCVQPCCAGLSRTCACDSQRRRGDPGRELRAMSSFSDTFTKDQEKEGLLGYDDAAFYYFAGSIIVCIVLPWTFNLVYDLLFPGRKTIEKDFPVKSKLGSKYKYCKTAAMVAQVDAARKSARRCSFASTGLWLGQIVVLGSLWFCLYVIVVDLGEANEIKSFDPFQILEVSPSATSSEIKKGYHKLSLVYHPDKNPDDPLAASKFIQITKAYSALTDEVAKKNYEKYGNPDGPQNTKVGIGLPRFLLEKENQLMILSVFFFLLLFLVPMTFICYYQKTKGYAANGVMIETLYFYGCPKNGLQEATRVKNCPEFLAASAESRSMSLRPTDNAHMKPIMDAVTLHVKPKYTKQPLISRNQVLIWVHMQRLHHLLSPELRNDLDELLRYSMKISFSMVEIACMRDWFLTAVAMIEFRRCLLQGLDIKSSQLLQIPHFTEEVLKHCHRGKHAVASLGEFLSKEPEQRKGSRIVGVTLCTHCSVPVSSPPHVGSFASL